MPNPCPTTAYPNLGPRTRYQGSKRKLLPVLAERFEQLPFRTVLDAFGGSATVSYLLKQMGKEVTFNDYLQANRLLGTAIIENDAVRLSSECVEALMRPVRGHDYDRVVERNYQDIYFTDDENRWLDRVAQNIARLADPVERAVASAALFQACIIKRPYNLFHRKNLYMRLAEVKRSFGNKTAWDRPFADHFEDFVSELNQAVFRGAHPCRALCCDAREVPGEYDLVYLDPPYVNGRGQGVDYFAFYHFLEGLSDYPDWETRINHRRKHRPLHGDRSPWSDKHQTRQAFRELFDRYRNSIVVLSYRSDGIPNEEDLLADLRTVKSKVECIEVRPYQYALSKNRKSRELLFVAR